jgi:secreted Zn-dependent insulinase-like peptidase
MLNADFYTRLRTEQQLGYIVTSSPYPLRDVPGVLFLVQSPVAGPAQLALAFDAFIASWRQRSPEALQALFEQHRAVLMQRLAEKPKNLIEKGGMLWRDLQEGYTGFDSREQLIEAMHRLDFTTWQRLFERDLLGAPGRSLWLASNGRFKDQPLHKGVEIGDLEAFKEGQRYYRFP